ncbi:MAG: hypothetical protein P8X89_21105 [Reinekea sp.]
MLPKNWGEPMGAPAIFEKQIEIKLLHPASTLESRIQVCFASQNVFDLAERLPMIHNLRLAKLFWTLTSFLALFAALGGVIFKDIYLNLYPEDFLSGALPQDVLTIMVCLLLFWLIRKTKENDVKLQVIILGLLGSFFYLYGIFTIERVYNGLYLLYLATFAASFWSIIYSLSGFKSESCSTMTLDRRMLKTTAFISILIAIIFTVLWIFALIPLMKAHNRIEFLYSIYILDLCFVMPAFIMVAVMSLRGMALGILMAPAIMILGFFVIFPLGLNELAKLFNGIDAGYGPMVVSFLFSFLMLTIAILQLRMIRFDASA